MRKRVHDEFGAFANELSVKRLARTDLRTKQFTLSERALRDTGGATVAEPPTNDPNTAAIALTMAGSIAYPPLAIWQNRRETPTLLFMISLFSPTCRDSRSQIT
jgi:hypothetical protein